MGTTIILPQDDIQNLLRNHRSDLCRPPGPDDRRAYWGHMEFDRCEVKPHVKKHADSKLTKRHKNKVTNQWRPR